MNAAPQFNSDLDGLESQIRSTMPSQAAQLQFDVASRRYRANLAEDSGRFLDQQSNNWYDDVTTNSVNVSQNSVAANPNDARTVAGAAADTTNALVQQAVRRGANANDPTDPLIQDAHLKGRQITLKTQIQSIATTNPTQALGIVQKNQALLGTDYAPLYDSLRTQATAQTGTNWHQNYIKANTPATTAAYATSPANPTNPVYTETAQQLPGGMSASGLARTVQIESGGRDLTNKFGYAGYTQFGPHEWATYGAGGNIHDFGDSVRAAQRYAIANGQQLSTFLGRQPTDAELYLAHQQGAGGAKKLLAIPNAPAAQAIGYNAVYNNLPTPLRSEAGTITSQEFVSYWTRKFNGTAPANDVGPSQGTSQPVARADLNPASAPWDQSATGSLPITAPVPLATSAPTGTAPDATAALAPQVGTSAVPPPSVAGIASTATTPAVTVAAGVPVSPRPSLADEFQAIEADPNLNPQEKDAARKAAIDDQRAQAVADDTTAAQVKTADTQALSKYGTALYTGQWTPQLQAQMESDQSLTFESKKALNEAITANAERLSGADVATYGPKFQQTMGQVLADPGDPSRISNANELYQLVASHDLTLAGANYLTSVMDKTQKDVDDTATLNALNLMMQKSKPKISFSTTNSGVPMVDADGDRLYSNVYVPRVMAAYGKAVSEGKPLWGPTGFFSQSNMDALTQGIRSPREMALAQTRSTAPGVDSGGIPPPPQVSNPDAWSTIINNPPALPSGRPMTQQGWAYALNLLIAQPTTTQIQHMDEKMGAGAALDAKTILQSLGIPIRDPAAPGERENIFPTIVGAADAVPPPAHPNAATGHVR